MCQVSDVVAGISTKFCILLYEPYLCWQADGVPVWRRKLQLPSEDLIKQLLLHIILTEDKKENTEYECNTLQ